MYKVCDKCNGTGYKTPTAKLFGLTCSACFGTGKRFSPVSWLEGQKPSVTNRPAKPVTEKVKVDSPTKPSHYHSGGIDVFTYAAANFTDDQTNAYHQITAIKYITRAGKKDGNPYEQDIKKAIVHLQECLKGEEE